jgi:hypothetical protein
MPKIVRETKIGSGMKSFRIRASDVMLDMSFDERIAHYEKMDAKKTVKKREKKLKGKHTGRRRRRSAP